VIGGCGEHAQLCIADAMCGTVLVAIMHNLGRESKVHVLDAVKPALSYHSAVPQQLCMAGPYPTVSFLLAGFILGQWGCAASNHCHAQA
jgi:hypothetical protein